MTPYQSQQQGAMAGWQGQMAMAQYPGQYNQQQQQGYPGQQQQQQQQYPMTPLNFPGSLAGDVQCGDVSQSSQTKPRARPPTRPGPTAPQPQDTPTPAGNSTTQQQQPQPQPHPQPPTAPVATAGGEVSVAASGGGEDKKVCGSGGGQQSGSGAAQGNGTGFMRPDRYQRTLEYVQQCRSWSSTAVKEEVTSTTDQKPQLNPNGTVAGYTAPSPAPTPQQQQAGSRFATPLPAALAETSNMVINDMTSSLTSLQEENKYLQMIQ